MLTLVGVIGAVAGALAMFVLGLLALPKIRAEARKLNAEASATEWGTLRDEIERLSGQVAGLQKEIETIKEASASRETDVDRENKMLRGKVRRLELRVKGLEDIFKVCPITPDMQDMLDELDRKTGGRK